MSESPNQVLEAVRVLIAKGRRVEPYGEDLLLWLVDGQSLTDHEIVAFALRLGLMDEPKQLQ